MVELTTVGISRQGSKARFALGFIAASAVWIVLILVVMRYWWTPTPVASTPVRAPSQAAAVQPSPVLAHEASGTKANVAALVAQRLASLRVPAKTVTLPSDLALQAEVAIKGGDFATADRIAGAVLARSKLSGWSFYPFASFMSRIVGAGDDSQLEWQLHKWSEQEPSSAFPYLISAQYFYTTGWAVRSEDVDSEVPFKDMSLFGEDMVAAAGDVQRAIVLNPHVPWSYYLLLRILTGYGNTGQMDAAFQQAIHAYPTYYPLYQQRLFTLTPKWGGSVAGMYSFVDRYAGSAAAGSPLKLLYLQLYAYLADASAFDCSGQSDFDGCARAEMSRIVSQQLGSDVLGALRVYKVSDPNAYSNAIWPILGRMISLYGSNDWSGLSAILQMAGHVMGSDEQIMDARPGHNNYVLDDIDARIFEQMSDEGDAEKKFAETLSDVENTTFTDQDVKDEAMGAVYDDMASFAQNSRHFIDVIAYQEAANAIAGSNHSDTPYETCYAYWALRLPEEAIKQCTLLINGNGNYLESRYWRALSYDEMHDWSAALADFEPIADGANNYYRVGAAIEESVIYGNMHDAAGQLRNMNSHPYLFDPALQASDDLATAFNNRCYAYMQLGDLHKALADCTTSLKYGHIPDAYHKQLELMARLGIKPNI